MGFAGLPTHTLFEGRSEKTLLLAPTTVQSPIEIEGAT